MSVLLRSAGALAALALGVIAFALSGSGGQGGGCGDAAPVTAGQLTSGQQQFAGELAADTGLDPAVVTAWVLAAESGSHAGAKAAANNNDWLNVGYTDSGTYGSTDSVWSDPITAADTTAGWLHGQAAIAGYGTATAAIHAILTTAGQPADAQITAIQASGWASSGYPDLPARYADVTAGGGGGAVPVSLDLGPSAACGASTGETLTPGAVASILPDGQATIRRARRRRSRRRSPRATGSGASPTATAAATAPRRWSTRPAPTRARTSRRTARRATTARAPPASCCGAPASAKTCSDARSTPAAPWRASASRAPASG